LPFEDESFDLVVCALVLCHFADFKPVVAEFARVLRPGGHLLVTDFHPDIVSAGARTSFNREGERYVLPNPPLTATNYVDAATDAGLSVREVVEIPLSAAPAWSMSEAFAQTFKDNHLCLILLAQRM
jgi:ubiquinone/menaquinone biosynthesis C-methylase UbiE